RGGGRREGVWDIEAHPGRVLIHMVLHRRQRDGARLGVGHLSRLVASPRGVARLAETRAVRCRSTYAPKYPNWKGRVSESFVHFGRCLHSFEDHQTRSDLTFWSWTMTAREGVKAHRTNVSRKWKEERP